MKNHDPMNEYDPTTQHADGGRAGVSALKKPLLIIALSLGAIGGFGHGTMSLARHHARAMESSVCPMERAQAREGQRSQRSRRARRHRRHRRHHHRHHGAQAAVDLGQPFAEAMPKFRVQVQRAHGSNTRSNSCFR